MKTIRWGILGTGNIAKQFARGLAVLPDADLIAVGSRSQSSAAEFAREFTVPHRHDSYEALANNPDVDVVYVATPHTLHYANSMLCLQAGKAVLCEKPFTINAHEAAALIEVAQQAHLFLMEAMWTRFLPALVRVRELIAAGTIGDVHLVQADFGVRATFDPTSRLFDPHLGGGALMDLGVYPVSLASMLFGPPTRISSLAQLGATGVDEHAAIVFEHADGQLALLATSLRTASPHEAWIMGTKGMIRINSPWWHATSLTLRAADQETQIDLSFEGNGYQYEALEVMECLRAGRRESAVMPLNESLQIMQTLDALRKEWGVQYPMEG